MQNVMDQCVAMLAILNDGSLSDRQRIIQSHDILAHMISLRQPPESIEPATSFLAGFKSFLLATDTPVVSEQVAKEQVSYCEHLREFVGTQLSREKTQLISRLDQVPGRLPIEAMHEIRRYRELMIPALIERLEHAADQNIEAMDLSPAKLVALYMLAEFKASEALPSLMRILALPDEQPFELFGDAITEDMSTILAQIVPDSPQILDPIIFNSAANGYVRCEALEVYLHHMRDGRLTREATLEHLTKYLQHALESRDSDLATGVIFCLKMVAPREVLKEIKSAFDADLVDEGVIRYKSVEDAAQWNTLQIEEALNNRLHQPITDAIEELSRWACFREDRQVRAQTTTIPSPHLRSLGDGRTMTDASGTVRSTARPGRNDQCPCGSGKKYKKCCALKRV